MESLEVLDAHRRGVSRLVPILDAVRSIAELAWRNAERGFEPLDAYATRLRTSFAGVVATLSREERAALVPRDRLPVGLLVVGAERGLCGAFNERLVDHALAQRRALGAQGATVRMLCLGRRTRRLLEAAHVPLLYTRALASLAVPAYVDVQAVALDLLALTERKAFGRLLVVHNAPRRRFEYAPATHPLLPPELPPAGDGPPPAVVVPAGDRPLLLTHLMTEQVLVGLYRSVMESVISEQLARIYTMRLAADHARHLVDHLTLQCNLARRNAITNSLLEIVAGYDATMRAGLPGAGPAGADGDQP